MKSQTTFGEWVNKWRTEWEEALGSVNAGLPRLLDAELEKMYGKRWLHGRVNHDKIERWMYVGYAGYDHQNGQGILKVTMSVLHLASLPAAEFESEGYTHDYILDAQRPTQIVLMPPTVMPEVCTDEEWICMLNLMVPGLPRMGREYW